MASRRIEQNPNEQTEYGRRRPLKILASYIWAAENEIRIDEQQLELKMEWSKQEMDDHFFDNFNELRKMPDIVGKIRSKLQVLLPDIYYNYVDKDGQIKPIPKQINTPLALKNFFRAIEYDTPVPIIVLKKKEEIVETTESETEKSTDEKKKVLGEGFLDVAAITSNVALLISVVDKSSDNKYFEAIIILIAISIALEVICGIILVVLGTKESADKKRTLCLRRLNSANVIVTMGITTINIFISALRSEFINEMKNNCSST